MTTGPPGPPGPPPPPGASGAPGPDLPEGVDPRSARFAGGVMAVTLVAAFAFGAMWAVPVWLVLRLATAALPPRMDPTTILYELIVAPRLAEPAHWEDPAPLRFQALLEAAALAVAALAAWAGIGLVAWVLALGAAGAAALLAVADVCVGCEVHERYEHHRAS